MTQRQKFSTVIAADQSAAQPGIDLSASTLTAARERLPMAEALIEDAQERVSDIESSWERLEDTYTPAEHAEATSALQRAKLQLSGATKALARAERDLRSSDLTLATLVADAVRKALPGVETFATFVHPSERPREADLPCAVVVQTAAPKLSRDGTVSGAVEVVFYRSTIHRALDPRKIADAADVLNIPVRTDAVRDKGNGTDSLRVEVVGAHTSAPIIAAIEPRDLRRIAHLFASNLAQSIRYEGSAVRFDQGSGAYVTSHIAAWPHEAAVVSELFEDDGTRTLVLDSSILLRVMQAPYGFTVADEIESLVSTFNSGQFVPSLGTITGMERVHESSLRISPDQAAVAMSVVDPDDLPINATEVGYVTPDQIILRTVLRSMSVGLADAA